MHKNEAAQLFEVLSNPNRVKVVKMLYHNDSFSSEKVMNILSMDNDDAIKNLECLVNNQLLVLEGNMYRLNKDRVNELMSFIQTPCNCCRK